MLLLTQELRARLIANGQTRGDHVPVVKFFNPCGAATWLLSELDSDCDTLFGLCDLGFGCPELGSASLAEIASVRVSFGLKIERDLHFAATHLLTVYAEAACQHGGIVESDAALAEADQRLTRERVESARKRDALPPSIPSDGGTCLREGSPRAGKGYVQPQASTR